MNINTMIKCLVSTFYNRHKGKSIQMLEKEEWQFVRNMIELYFKGLKKYPDNTNEKIYWILNDMKQYKKCICGNDITNYDKGRYHDHCSKYCSDHDPNTKTKTTITLFNNWKLNNEIPFFSENVQKLRWLIETFPRHYQNILKLDEFHDIITWIYNKTPLLDNSHTMATRVYWVLNNLTDFPRCCNKNCNNPMMGNVKSVSIGYDQTGRGLFFCSRKCMISDERIIKMSNDTKDKLYGKKQHLLTIKKQETMKKNGTEFTFCSKEGYEKGRKTLVTQLYNRIKSNEFVEPMFSLEYFLEHYRSETDQDVDFDWKCKICGREFKSKCIQYYSYSRKNNRKYTYARCPHVDSGFAGKSNEEAIILDNLKIIFPENEYEILYGTRENYKLLNPFQLDFIIKTISDNNIKLAIEYNGCYWHSVEWLQSRNVNNIPTRHLNKTIKCENLNIPLIHIYEDEWMNEREKILNLLQQYRSGNFEFSYEKPIIELERDKFSKLIIPNGFKLINETNPQIQIRIPYEKHEYQVYDCGKLIYEKQ